MPLLTSMFKTQKPHSLIKDFQILSKLGEGAFSTVFKARRNSDNQIYALKKVRMDALTEKERENALQEVRILASINDPFIIAYKEVFFDEDSNNLCIIMEYAEQGDLQKRIKDCLASKKYLPEKELWKFLIHISKALQTLHSMQILHRDLKSANVFITNDGFLKLGDLNVSKITSKGLAYTQTGTPYYASPEVWRDESYDIKSDIWSLGCVLYEMAALKPPFQANDMSLLFNKVQNGAFEKIPRCYSDELAGVINLCLKVNPKERPLAAEILKIPTVMGHLNEVEGHNFVKKNSKINLLNKIELPKNLAFLKERLPKPNYEKNSYYPDSDEEIMVQVKKEEKNTKTRGFSAESKRNEVIVDKSKLINHLKNNAKIDLKLSPNKEINVITPNNSLIKRINFIQNSNNNSNNNNNYNPITKISNMNGLNLQNFLLKNSNLQNSIQKSPIQPIFKSPTQNNNLLQRSPSTGIGSPASVLKLPSITKVSNNSNILQNNSPQMTIFNLKKQLDFNNNTPMIIKHNKPSCNSIINENPLSNRIKYNVNLAQIERNRLVFGGAIRPNSQDATRLINNCPNINIKQGINPNPSYKIVLKNRPLSHNLQRNESNNDNNYGLIKREEQNLHLNEEKDLEKTANKLRPFSCNSNRSKIEPMPHLINNNINIINNRNYPIKVNEAITGLGENYINAAKKKFLDEYLQNTSKQTNIVLNNRGLLFNQKPVTAPNIQREGTRIVQKIQHIDKNSQNLGLYSKQALDIVEKGVKSHFCIPNLNAGNTQGYK